jgi:4-alpha-glucanotransferase
MSKSVKKAGALLAVSSLPSLYGIGDLGDSAYQFVDILKSMHIKLWQVLPLNPLGYGNSPYQAYSSFAGDELYISIDRLIEWGLLSHDDIVPNSFSVDRVDYIPVRKYKNALFAKAFKNFTISPGFGAEYRGFIANNQWVSNYALFLTLKSINGGKLWTEWPNEHISWVRDQQCDLSPYQEQIDYQIFLQFMFYRQWLQLKAYANSCNIEIIGDLPIYLGFDSEDVWQNQEIFLLDKQHNPTFVAGVPPDFFSVTGQRWGNPLYDWEALQKDGFKFWINRLCGNAKLFDIIRIDHFRAFDTYWKIPAKCKTAVDGVWEEAPGYALFDTIFQQLPDIKIVVEDLGDLRPEVLELRDHYNLKGMKVFQFDFDPVADKNELETTTNCIIYTGTHDNDTLYGWYIGLPVAQKQHVRNYFKIAKKQRFKKLQQAIIAYILHAKAQFVIFPVQDLLGLDSKARFNTPSTVGSPNWEWRMPDYNKLRNEAPVIAQAILASGR